MRKMVNGILVDLSADEAAAKIRDIREQELRERSRPLTGNEVLAFLIPGIINTAPVDDNTALRMTGYYPEWESGIEYTNNAGRPVGYRVRRGEKLYKLRQEHTSQIGWEPENAASLWEQVCESHTGTEDDPIPYEGNLALTSGLYYTQDYRLFRCIRDTGSPVYHRLEELVGLYVEEVI